MKVILLFILTFSSIVVEGQRRPKTRHNEAYLDSISRLKNTYIQSILCVHDSIQLILKPYVDSLSNIIDNKLETFILKTDTTEITEVDDVGPRRYAVTYIYYDSNGIVRKIVLRQMHARAKTLYYYQGNMLIKVLKYNIGENKKLFEFYYWDNNRRLPSPPINENGWMPKSLEQYYQLLNEGNSLLLAQKKKVTQ